MKLPQESIVNPKQVDLMSEADQPWPTSDSTGSMTKRSLCRSRVHTSGKQRFVYFCFCSYDEGRVENEFKNE